MLLSLQRVQQCVILYPDMLFMLSCEASGFLWQGSCSLRLHSWNMYGKDSVDSEEGAQSKDRAFVYSYIRLIARSITKRGIRLSEPRSEIYFIDLTMACD